MTALKTGCLLWTLRGPETNKAAFWRERFKKECGCFQEPSNLVLVTVMQSRSRMFSITEWRNMECRRRREWNGLDTQSQSLGKLCCLLWATLKWFVLQWTKTNFRPFLSRKFPTQMSCHLGGLWGYLCQRILFSQAYMLSGSYSHLIAQSLFQRKLWYF